MEEKLRRIESDLERISKSLEAFEARITRIENSINIKDQVKHATHEKKDGLTLASTGGEAGVGNAGKTYDANFITIFALVGRTFLILAGAFFLRAVTGEGLLPQAIGVTIGFVYSLAWLMMASRDGSRGRLLSATLFGIASVLMVYPLLWETTAKMKALSPGVTTALMAFITAVSLWIAWLRKLRAVAWAVAIAVLITCSMLMLQTTEFELFTAPVILLGVIAVWLAYSREWDILQWLLAFIANCYVLLMIWLFSMADSTGRFAHLSIAWVTILLGSMLVLYLGSFSARILLQGKNLKIFELLQSICVLILGLGGMALVVHRGESDNSVLGIFSLLAGGLFFLAALAYFRRYSKIDSDFSKENVDFYYFAWIGLILVIYASAHLIHSSKPLSLAWCSLALIAACLGGIFDRITLRAHSVVYLVSAVLVSGLLDASIRAFVSTYATPWPTHVCLVLACVTLCYILLVVTHRKPNVIWPSRLPRFALLLISVFGTGGLLVALVSLLFHNGYQVEPHVLAAIRTAVLGTSAMVLAFIGARTRCVEFSWLVYPVLFAGGLKLLVEDLRKGQPITIFLGFLIYGLALIVAPRLMRQPARKEE